MTKPRIECYYKYSEEKKVALKVLRKLLKNRYESILDVGCGDGTLSHFLNARTANLHLCEISPFYEKKLRSSFPQAHIEIDDIWNIYLKKYDLIHFSQGLYYHSPEKWLALVDHLVKSLNPGGELVLIMNCDEGDWWEAVKSVWQHYPKSLKFHYLPISQFLNLLRTKYKINEQEFSYGVKFPNSKSRDSFIAETCVPLRPEQANAIGLLNRYVDQLPADFITLEYRSVVITIGV